MIKVFISDLDSRMRLTFNMYDFNGDGLISKEDVRIVLSYIPFKRDQVDNFAHQTPQSDTKNGTSKKEGLYEQEEGKVLEHKDRVTDQEEIKSFANMVFESTSHTG